VPAFGRRVPAISRGLESGQVEIGILFGRWPLGHRIAPRRPL